MATNTPEITIPADIKPADGRFGSGPSKVRPEQIQAVMDASPEVMGTSHRQGPVKFVVGSLRNGLAELLQLPDGYEIMLGNGGTHAFWDGLVAGFIEQRSLHATFGEFSSKFAKGVAAAPFLDDPVLVESEVGTHPTVTAVDGVDTYALTHNETSTGVMMPVRRPDGPAVEGGWWWSTPPPPPAGCGSISASATCTTSRPRRRWPPTVGCGWPRSPPPPSSASSPGPPPATAGSRRSSTSPPRSTTPARTRRSTRRRWPR